MGDKQFGRWKRKPKNIRYRDERRHLKNKHKRVLRSSGEAEAARWFRKYVRRV